MTAPVLSPEEREKVDAVGVHDLDILAEMEEHADDEPLCCSPKGGEHAASIRSICVMPGCRAMDLYCTVHFTDDLWASVLYGPIQCGRCRVEGATIYTIRKVVPL